MKQGLKSHLKDGHLHLLLHVEHRDLASSIPEEQKVTTSHATRDFKVRDIELRILGPCSHQHIFVKEEEFLHGGLHAWQGSVQGSTIRIVASTSPQGKK
jgi:hypothetical protein